MPGVPVVFRGPNRKPYRTFALVDSGADSSVLPIELAPTLGVDLAACQQVVCHTAGGPATQYQWQDGLEATVMRKKIKLHAYFADTFIALLGREDFFRHFKVEFNQRLRYFTLTPFS